MSGVCDRAVRGVEDAGRVVVEGEAGEGHEMVHLGVVSLGWKRGSEELTFDGNVMRSATVLRWSAVQPGARRQACWNCRGKNYELNGA
jgi:hypothetical protein